MFDTILTTDTSNFFKSLSLDNLDDNHDWSMIPSDIVYYVWRVFARVSLTCEQKTLR